MPITIQPGLSRYYGNLSVPPGGLSLYGGLSDNYSFTSDPNAGAIYFATNYNSDYDCLPNLSNLTGDAVFGANLYSDRARIYGGVGYLPGTSGDNFSTASSAAITASSQVELVVRMSPTNASATNKDIFGRYSTAGNLRAYTLATVGAKRLCMFISDNGTNSFSAPMTVDFPWVSGQSIWIRATYSVATNLASYYYAADTGNNTEPTSWIFIESVTLSGSPASIFDNGRPLIVGGKVDQNTNMAGTYYYASMRKTIGGSIDAVFNPSAVPNYAYGWVSSLGALWTTNVSTAYQLDWQYKVQPAQLGSAGFYTNARVWGGIAYFTGTGNYVRCPDSVALSIVGDLEVGVDLYLADWTPAGNTDIIAKWGSSGQFSFALEVTTAGALLFAWTADGTNILSKTSTATLARPDGTRISVKATLDVDNGAAGHDVKFYTSFDNVNWTQLGATVTTAGVTSIFDGNSSLQISGRDTVNGAITGGVFSAYVKDGIGGTTVATFAPASVADMATSWTDVQGNVWTITKTTGADTNDPTRLVFTGQQYVYSSGVSGNYVSTVDAAPLDVTGDISLVGRIGMRNALLPANNLKVVSKVGSGGNNEAYWLDWTTGGFLSMFTTPNGLTGSRVNAVSTTSLPYAVASSLIWVRADRDVDNGAGGNTTTFYYSLQDVQDESQVIWTQLGAPVVNVGTTSIYSNNAPVELGAWQSGIGTTADALTTYAAIYNGIYTNKVAKFDASLVPMNTPAGQAGYTDPINSTVWTFNRSATGKKLALVDRTLLLEGTDDYLEVADHPLLDFAGADSFTVSVANRTFGSLASQTRIAKKVAAGTTGVGYLIRAQTGTPTTNNAELYDGTNSATPAIASSPVAAAATLTAVVRTSGTSTVLNDNGTVNSTASNNAIDVRNSEVLRVGRLSGAGTNYADQEVFGFSTFRKALTTTELAKLKNELGAY